MSHAGSVKCSEEEGEGSLPGSDVLWGTINSPMVIKNPCCAGVKTVGGDRRWEAQQRKEVTKVGR